MVGKGGIHRKVRERIIFTQPEAKQRHYEQAFEAGALQPLDRSGEPKRNTALTTDHFQNVADHLVELVEVALTFTEHYLRRNDQTVNQLSETLRTIPGTRRSHSERRLW
ncbi:MAG: hypothetical protein DME52_06000 [Verrucomicrobia bacterium]|nr:MAG: hypothetical protein DME52_06000 [Verrucomicrobiota bacterium]